MNRLSLNCGETSSNRGGGVVLAITLAALAACPALARTVTVASCDRSTGATTLAISAAEAGDGAKALIAAWSPSDIGNAVTNARETAYVGVVAAAETEKSFTIPSAWRGKAGFVRFYLMADVPPYDARLDSLRSASAGPYIDTGFVPTVNSDIRVKSYNPSDMAAFGVSGRCYLFSTSPYVSNYYYGFFGASGQTAAAPRGTVPHEHWINATGAHIDGICYFAFNPADLTSTTSSTLTLFARKVNGDTTVAKQGDCTMYWAQIRENGVLVHDYVPCVKNGVATLYDRKAPLADAFCTVLGSGSFTAGEEICPDAQDCGGVESATDALMFGPVITVTAIDSASAEATVSFAGTHDEGVLYAVADTADRGTNVSAWANIAFLGKVAADAATVTLTMPNIWILNGYQMRILWRSAVDFPYDREVEWLYSEGSAWVSSSVFPTKKTKIEVCGKSAWNVGLFGLSTYFNILPFENKLWYGFFGQSSSFDFSTSPSAAFHTYTLGPEGVFVDGTQKADFTGQTMTYANMTKACPLFLRRDWSTGDIQKNGQAWIKSAKIWEEGRLLRDFVPCVSNGVACLYDRVRRECCSLASTATGALDPGETVISVADEEAVTWSAVFIPDAAAAIWDGGGADNSFATAENWVGDELPNLSGGLTTLTFATGGSEAQVPASGAVVGCINFDTAGNFALTAASGGSLSLGDGGITLADRAVAAGSTWRLHDLNLPITLSADQTWNLSPVSGQRLRVYGNVQGAASRTLTVTGSGCLSLYATNDFAGNVVLSGGVTKVFSKLRPFGSAAEGGEVFVDQSTGAKLEFYYGAVVDKPLRIRSNSSGTTFSTGRNGDTAFLAPIYQTGNDFYVMQEAGSTLTFGGGGTFDNTVIFHPEESSVRTVVVEGAPLVQPTYHSFSFKAKTELHLKNQGNQMSVNLGAVSSGGGSTLHCWTNNVINYQYGINLGWGSFMDLHGFDQEVGDLWTGGSGRIRSAEPATLLAVFNGSAVTWGAGAGVDGAVNLTKSGLATLTINGTNTTTGVLFARNGPLVIGETGYWQGTNVLVGATNSNRHASLRLARSNSFADPGHTILTMTTSTASTFYTDCGESREPELILDAGVNAVFRKVKLNGRSLARGTWGGPESSAQHKDGNHFSGSGMIMVIGSGITISIK